MIWLFAPILFCMSVAFIGLGLGMMIVSARSHYIFRLKASLLNSLMDYAIDHSWNETTVSMRMDWLKTGPIRFISLEPPNIFQRLPSERDLVVGIRADDFWRWKAKREILDQDGKELAILQSGKRV